MSFRFFCSDWNLTCCSIDARSEARLRLLRTHRVPRKNKLKLEREWTLSFHEMANRDPTSKPFFSSAPEIPRDAD